MIVVKVELWPKGDPSRARPVGLATVALLGQKHDGDRGYEVKLYKDLDFSGVKAEEYFSVERIQRPPKSAIWRRLFVGGHYPGTRRFKEGRGLWDLLGGALSLLGRRLATYRDIEAELREAPQRDGEETSS